MRSILGARARKAGRTDEEHVQRVRRMVAAWDRWRPWLVAFYAAMAVAFVGILALAMYLIHRLADMKGNNAPSMLWLGFIVGLLIGANVGLLGLAVTHGLASSLRSFRTERLLLRYHDAIEVLAKGSTDAEPTNA